MTFGDFPVRTSSSGSWDKETLVRRVRVLTDRFVSVEGHYLVWISGQDEDDPTPKDSSHRTRTVVTVPDNTVLVACETEL